MSRPIDAYRAIDIIDEWLDSVGTVMVGKGLSSYGELIGCIEDTPTLTPPNEPLTCKGCMYAPDCPSEIHCHGCARMYTDHYRRPPEGETNA